jgi:hypothetical protein
MPQRPDTSGMITTVSPVPTTAGYSGTPLPRKLGIKEGHRVLLVQAPDGFALDVSPEVTVDRRPGRQPYDVLLLFVTTARDLNRRFPSVAARMTEAGGLWVCWPKRTARGPARLDSDLGDNAVRAIGLEAGLVDNKVCAIDETWSAMRFVVRLADRKGQAK